MAYQVNPDLGRVKHGARSRPWIDATWSNRWLEKSRSWRPLSEPPSAPIPTAVRPLVNRWPLDMDIACQSLLAARCGPDPRRNAVVRTPGLLRHLAAHPASGLRLRTGVLFDH